jgi:hypothetical protein
MTSPVSLNLNYAFNHLEQSEREIVRKEVYQQFVGWTQVQYVSFYGAAAKAFAKAFLLNTDPENLPENVRQVFDALNSKAEEKLNTHVTPWKMRSFSVLKLASYLQMAGYAVGASAIIPAGVAFYYLRSKKVLALASTCLAVALFVLGRSGIQLGQAFVGIYDEINVLNWKNQGQFNEKIDAVYEGLEKSNIVWRGILQIRRNKLGAGNQGKKLLEEQLGAFERLRRFGRAN